MSEIREGKGEKKERKGKEKRKRKGKEKRKREKEKKKKENEKEESRRASSLDLWHFDGRDFVGPRSNVRLRDEGYTWVSKFRSFTEDPTKEIREIPSTTLQEVGILPTFVYFPP